MAKTKTKIEEKPKPPIPPIPIKPCPCCGNADIYFGHNSADTMGLQCVSSDGNISLILCRLKKAKPSDFVGCGLRLNVHFPDKFPKGIKSLEQLEKALLIEAIQRWNTRNGKKT